MTFIAGSHEWLKTNAYRIDRCGCEWVVRDEEDGDAEVCRAKTHADAVRELLRLRFST